MLKRIMASILVVVLLVSLCLVTVSADDTQTSTIITQWDGTIPSNGTTVVEGKAFASTTDILSANRTMSHSERVAKGTYKNIDGNYDMKLFESAKKYFK